MSTATAAPPRPLVGVAVLITSSSHSGCILVGERKGSHGAATFATPGGHLEYGEEWDECAQREVKEETNLDLLRPMKHVATTNNVFAEVNKHYVTLFIRGEISPDSGDLQLMEPEKCVEWAWKSWDQLREEANSGKIKLFPPLLSLLNNKTFKFE